MVFTVWIVIVPIVEGLPRAERAANEYYPLDSADGSDLFEILSGPHIAAGLRTRVWRVLVHTKTGPWSHFLNEITFDWEIVWTSGFV